MVAKVGWKLGEKRTFAMDTGMTPGIIKIIADISDHSITTHKQRMEASRKYFKMFQQPTTSEELDEGHKGKEGE